MSSSEKIEYSGKHNTPELNLPWKIYFFNANGYYDKKDILTIHNPEDLKNEYISHCFKVQNQNKMEIRVCDSLEYCIMHWKDGERIFPK